MATKQSVHSMQSQEIFKMKAPWVRFLRKMKQSGPGQYGKKFLFFLSSLFSELWNTIWGKKPNANKNKIVLL